MPLNARCLIAVLTISAVPACDSDENAARLVGQLESDRIEIAADAAETIVRVAVAEGQSVKTGEMLLQQDTRRAEARLQEAEAMLAQSRARLDELTRGPREEQIAAARAGTAGAAREVAFRQTELRRAERLLAQDLASEESVDRAEAAVDAANAELKVQEARLAELLEGTTVEELRQAENVVQQNEARLALLRIDVERLSAFAPTDGIVDSILFEPGERPVPGQPMVILLSGAQPYARVYIPESIRASVVPGTRASVFVDGLPGPLSARVRWVSNEAAFTPYFALTERDRGRLSFPAKLDLADAPSDRRLPDGVPVEVELQAIRTD